MPVCRASWADHSTALRLIRSLSWIRLANCAALGCRARRRFRHWQPDDIAQRRFLSSNCYRLSSRQFLRRENHLGRQRPCARWLPGQSDGSFLCHRRPRMVAYRTDIQLQHGRGGKLSSWYARTGRYYGCNDQAWRHRRRGHRGHAVGQLDGTFRVPLRKLRNHQHTDLRTCPTGCGAPFTETVGYDVKLQTHTATFGFAYKFSDPLVASAAAPLV